MKYPNAPAFPGADLSACATGFTGLTKREYVATQIAAGLRAAALVKSADVLKGADLWTSSMIAKTAIQDADILLKMLDETKQP